MPKTIKTEFITSDGASFPSEEQAIAHEKLGEVLAEYNAACVKLNAAIAAKQLTADNQPFSLGKKYWFISFEPVLPNIFEISIARRGFELCPNDYRSTEVMVYGAGQSTKTLSIQNLYAEKKNAIEELLKQLEFLKGDLERHESRLRYELMK